MFKKGFIVFLIVIYISLFLISCKKEENPKEQLTTKTETEITSTPNIDPTVSDVYEEEKQRGLLKKLKETFISDVEMKKDSLKTIGKQIALDPNFFNIYKRLKIRVGNLNEVTSNNTEIFKIYGKILRERFEGRIREIEKKLKIPISYYFYLPPARSFVIPNLPPEQDIPLEDLSFTNISVVEAIKNRTILEGYEVNKEGILYKYIVPFYDDNGEVLGAIEVNTPILKMVESFVNKNPKVIMLILVKRDFEKILDTVIAQNRAKVLNNFILYYINDNFDLNLLNNYSLTVKQEDNVKIGNKLFLQIFLKDFKNNEIGALLLSTKE